MIYQNIDSADSKQSTWRAWLLERRFIWLEKVILVYFQIAGTVQRSQLLVTIDEVLAPPSHQTSIDVSLIAILQLFSPVEKWHFIIHGNKDAVLGNGNTRCRHIASCHPRCKVSRLLIAFFACVRDNTSCK